MLKNYTLFDQPLHTIEKSKVLINTLNAHSYNTAQKDKVFKNSLFQSDVLLPDGISVVLARRILTGEKLKKIAGNDLFFYEMKRLDLIGGKCFFLGSTDKTIEMIRQRASKEYPKVKVYGYSPPYKPEFSEEETSKMIEAVNAVEPEVLFVGMTAPKQEKWAYTNFDQLMVGHVCCIGAVFDFYAGKVNRAPNWLIKIGMEWSYRLIKEPRRMWRRYLIGNAKFIGYVIMEKIRN